MISTFFEKHSDRTALVNPTEDLELSYRELRKELLQVIDGFEDGNLRPGQLLVSVSNPSPDFVKLYLSSIFYGLKFLPLDPQLPENKVKRIINKEHPDLLVTLDEKWTKQPIASEIETKSFDELTGNASGNATVNDRSESHRLLIRTSGTTAEPKTVVLSWENLVANAKSSTTRLETAPNDLWLSPLPVNHVGGIAPIIRSLLNGTGVAPVSYDSGKISDILRNKQITAISLVPRMLRQLLDEGLVGDQTNLRFILLGGGAASKSLIGEALNRDLPVRTTYGMTETASQVATARTKTLESEPGTVGKPLPNVDVSIENDNNSTTPAGEIGEIVVEGPIVAEGYREVDSDEQETFHENTFHTGDLGYLNESGYLWVKGRKDRLINTGGEVVNPQSIENELDRFNSIEDNYVIGIESSEWGEKIVAFVVSSHNENVSPESIKHNLNEFLPSYKVPKEIISISALPRTVSGTVDSEALIEIYSKNH